jgi:hypothetical protein
MSQDLVHGTKLACEQTPSLRVSFGASLRPVMPQLSTLNRPISLCHEHRCGSVLLYRT